MSKGDRPLPNILITGTPGTGKTLVCSQISEKRNVNSVNVGDVVKQYGFYEEKDEEFDTLVLDEDRLLDYLEEVQEKNGLLLEYHSSELFPERWFDLIVVLRTDNTILYDRLVQKGYKANKIENNIDCEIFQVCYDEALDSYQHSLVWMMQNDTPEQLDIIVNAVCAYIDQWPRSFGISSDVFTQGNTA
ncbi:Adenylate kinase isoenzyme 6-like protein [Entamoeba marina]